MTTPAITLDKGSHDNPDDGMCLLERRDERLDLWVVGCDGAALPQIAGSASKYQVLRSRFASLGRGHEVVQVVDPTFPVEELEHAARRQRGFGRSGSAVLAYPRVAFGHCVSDARSDVAAVRHAMSLAARCARRCAGHAIDLFRTMITPGTEV